MRRALSYLEVLIAAAIALTGLLGVVAMFPVAILNMQKGVVVDTMAAVAPSALDQASAMGALEQRNWLLHDYYGPNTGAWNVPATLAIGAPAPAGPPLPLIDNTPWASFCIDARFAAEMPATPASATVAPHLFPYYPRNPAQAVAINEARMLRVTLKRNPGETAPVPMSIAHSRLMFKVSDDLIFDKPGDATLPATQNFILGGAAPVNQRRNYMADYEFIVTRSPRIDGVPVYSDGTSYNRLVAGGGQAIRHEVVPIQLYTTSVVVFYKRRARLDAIVPTVANDPAAERIVPVATFYSGGLSGGDVQIQSAVEDELLLHEGDWVMLSGNRYDGNGTFLGPLFQWYRVVSLSTTTLNGANYERDVSLEGGDWPAGVPAQMTILTGAVGVFETAGPG